MKSCITSVGGGVLGAFLLTTNAWASCGPATSATITNLPTLGGPFFAVSALNSAGDITGYSSLALGPDFHPFLYTDGATSDLGSFGGSLAEGLGLNSAGHVVGYSYTVGNLGAHAFFYPGSNALIDLDTLGGSVSVAMSINDAGQIVGYSNLEGDLVTEPFLYENNLMTTLGSLGGNYGTAVAINQSGEITGFSNNSDGNSRAYRYSNDTMTDLGTLGGSYSVGFDLNNSGMVIGESTTIDEETHAFACVGTNMVDLGTFGGTYSSAVDVNNAGQVIGIANTTDDMQTHGFIYSGGTLTDLGHLGGDYSDARAINDLGQVVGSSDNAESRARAFIWQDGVMTDLNTLLPPGSGWVLEDAGFINNAGRIVGTGRYLGSFKPYILDLGSGDGDNQPPVAAAGANQTMECPDAVTLDGSGSSDPDGDALSYLWMEGATVLGTNVTLTVDLGLGSHVITLTVTDPCGASSQATVLVDVVDTAVPVIASAPAPITVSADASCQGAVPDVVSGVVASDGCTGPGQLVMSQNPDAGTLLGTGSYLIVVTVTDAANNSASTNILFTVADTTAPVIGSVPSSLTVSADGNCRAAVPGLAVVASDNCTPADQLLITQTPAAGTLLGRGAHTIVVTVKDAAGNSASASVSFTVADTTAPVILSVPGSLEVSTDANCQAAVPNVLGGVVVTDNCTPGEQLVVTQSPPAGAMVDRGNHTIVVAVTDASGNSATASVSLAVNDTTAPVIVTAPSTVSAPAGANCQATVPNVLSSVVASDNCTPAGQLVKTQNPEAGTLVGSGQYPIVVTVEDAAGNQASHTVLFVVAETTAPVIESVSASPNSLSPPNDSLVLVTVSVTASDNCDPAPLNQIISVTSNEPVSQGDIQIMGNVTVRLAASRNPGGNGRVYTITVRSMDASGNSSTATTTVSVPKGNGNGNGGKKK